MTGSSEARESARTSDRFTHPVSGSTVSGRYELREVVGAGGMATVFRAHDLELDRDVAIKVLREGITDDPDALARFEREARTAAGLSHENIVAVLDRGNDRGRPYIVYEYFGASDLMRVVREDGPLPLDRALSFALQIARGLAFAHRHGCIHRDVKPRNVLVEGTRATTSSGSRACRPRPAPVIAPTSTR